MERDSWTVLVERDSWTVLTEVNSWTGVLPVASVGLCLATNGVDEKPGNW